MDLYDSVQPLHRNLEHGGRGTACLGASSQSTHGASTGSPGVVNLVRL